MTRKARVPIGVAFAVAPIAAASFGMLALADRAGWAVHGPAPPWLAPGAWVALFVGGWLLMVNAMMLPSSLPFLAAASRLGGASAAWTAGASYVALWGVLGLLLCLGFWLGGTAIAGIAPDARLRIAGASLILAGLYQATPIARRCQRACAQPFAIFARCWRGRRARPTGAAAAGLLYGLNCIGCCAGMIVVMALVGLHDLVMMALLAAAMVVQKTVRWGAAFGALASLALSLAGVALLAGWWKPMLLSLTVICGG